MLTDLAVVVATVLLVEFFLQHRSKHKVKPFDSAADESSSVHSKKGVEVVVRVNEDQRATVALLRNGAGQHLLRWRSHDATPLRVQRNGEACELRDGECSLYGYPVCELVPAEASKGKRVTRSLKEDELLNLAELEVRARGAGGLASRCRRRSTSRCSRSRTTPCCR